MIIAHHPGHFFFRDTPVLSLPGHMHLKEKKFLGIGNLEKVPQSI